MDNLFRIYFDVLGNFVGAFLLFRFAEFNLKKEIKIKDKLILLTLNLVYSIPEKFSFASLISIVITLLFLLFVTL